MPVLVDAGRTVIESSIIIEQLDLHHSGPVPLLPRDAMVALEVRTMDRFLDNYISTPQQKIVFDSLRPEPERDARGVTDARAVLDTAYDWLERRMAGRNGQPVSASASPTAAPLDQGTGSEVMKKWSK
jgi:glutathione S-transferase